MGGNPVAGNLAEAMVEALPLPVFVFDRSMAIRRTNKAAERVVRGEASVLVSMRCGEALHCLRAFEAEEGCGHHALCQDCGVRTAAVEAFRTGKAVRARAHLVRAGAATGLPCHLLITASPLTIDGEELVVVVMENLPDLIAVSGVVPICAWCKKIKDSEDAWRGVEQYLNEQIQMDFTHGICPECAARFTPDSERS